MLYSQCHFTSYPVIVRDEDHPQRLTKDTKGEPENGIPKEGIVVTPIYPFCESC